jgi:uncharacterized protein (TIGR02147 family)
MAISVFDFDHYGEFVKSWLKTQPRGGHGLRRKMADAIGRQSVFVSQVLHGDADLSLSQAQNLAQWMRLGLGETHQFLLLVQKSRADSENLKSYFSEQIQACRKQHLDLKTRLRGRVEDIPENDRARYYSSWYYGAIRLLTAIPEYQTAESITARLNLPSETVLGVLQYLVDLGLIEEKDGRYQITSRDIFLGKDSAMIGRHHANWRIRALDSFAREREDELHYSTAVVISEADADKIKRQLLAAIEANRTTVRESGSEELYCVSLDFFRV